MLVFKTYFDISGHIRGQGLGHFGQGGQYTGFGHAQLLLFGWLLSVVSDAFAAVEPERLLACPDVEAGQFVDVEDELFLSLVFVALDVFVVVPVGFAVTRLFVPVLSTNDSFMCIG